LESNSPGGRIHRRVSPGFLPGVNDKVFDAYGNDEHIASFLADAVVICLNSDPHHLIANFPPTIETIQDEVLHALRSYGFQNTADAYECYRWGRHWTREGAITRENFVGNGFPQKRMKQTLTWNRARGVHTVAGLNEAVRSGSIRQSWTSRWRFTRDRSTKQRKKFCPASTLAEVCG